MSAPLVFLDTETTSLTRDRRAWEIAMILRAPGLPPREVSFFVGDVDLSQADPMSLRVGRFHQRHPLFKGQYEGDTTRWWIHPKPLDRPGPHLLTELQAALVVERLTRGAHLVGAVPSFDAEVLADLLRRHRLVPAWHYHLIDVEALAVGYLHGRYGRENLTGPGIEPAEFVSERTFAETEPVETIARPWRLQLPWRSEDLSRACGVAPAPESERHTALGDARWAQRLYDAITTRRAVTA